VKKVALIGPELYPIPPIRGGAAELWIEKTSRELKRYRPIIFSPADPELPLKEQREGVEYIRIPVRRFKRTVYGWFNAFPEDYEKQVAAFLKKIDPDIIHIHNRPLLVSYFRKRFPRKRIILHMHNLYNYLGRLERPSGSFINQADLFLGCSRFVVAAEKNRLAVGTQGQEVLYNGVDIDAFRPLWLNPEETRKARERHGLVGKKVVLYTGKIRESKGVGVLVRAMGEVFQQEPETVWVLAGGTGFGYRRENKKTDFSERLREELAHWQDRVRFLGFIRPQEMPNIYLLGDIFVAPSQLEEGLGLVFLEASAGGLPIISTRQGGIPEVVIHEKTGLLLARKDDVSELTEKILGLLREPEVRRQLGERGRQTMEDYFSWTRIAEATERLYDSLV
jgi:glycosyltransferase involved in cell wall biosynthesis